MRRLIHFAAKLYPRAWRERYGDEFEALLDDTRADARTVFNVFARAVLMHVQQRRNIGATALLAAAALFAASWWAAQRPYISPGTHLVFHQDSNLGALVGFIVTMAALLGGLISSMFVDQTGSAARTARRASAGAFGVYVAAVLLVSLLSPRTIVSIGDGYCYDIWCIGVQRVKATPRGPNILYTAEVRIFSDANRVPASRERSFLYVIDEQGRRFPLVQDSSSIPLDVTVNPHGSVKTSLAFLAPADARNLYLTGDYSVMPWVPLYFGSDIAPFHRRTLLRLL